MITSAGSSGTTTTTLQTAAPALFRFSPSDNRYVAAVAADGTYLAPASTFGSTVTSHPAKPGETILLFATGLGATSPAVAAGVTGTLLGVHDDPTLTDTDIRLEPGDALVMVTDGVQDSRMPDGRLGEKRLVELVRRCHGLTATEIAGRIEQAVAAAPVEGPGDDVAVLVVRALPR